MLILHNISLTLKKIKKILDLDLFTTVLVDSGTPTSFNDYFFKRTNWHIHICQISISLDNISLLCTQTIVTRLNTANPVHFSSFMWQNESLKGISCSVCEKRNKSVSVKVPDSILATT